ncbi:MAG: hypothetical protein QXT43_00945 [Candidatus Micrarchaeaceae archaeon]
MAESSGMSRKRMIIVYSAAIAILAVAAVAIQLIVGSYTPIQRCESIAAVPSRYSCLQNLAFNTKNQSICGALPSNYSSSCYSEIAENTTNASVCGKISSASSKYACMSYIALLNGNSTLCGEEQKPYEGSCYLAIAVKYANASMCSYSANQTEASACVSEVMAKRALATGNAAYCNNVSSSLNSTLVDEIISNVSNASLRNVSIALAGYAARATEQLTQQAVSPFSAKDFCALGVAYTSRNVTACEYAAPSLLSVCSGLVSLSSAHNTTVANFTLELQSCNSAGSYEAICREGILIAEAVKTENISLCASLGSAASTCYGAVAEYTKNASVCLKISNSTLASACAASVYLNATG